MCFSDKVKLGPLELWMPKLFGKCKWSITIQNNILHLSTWFIKHHLCSSIKLLIELLYEYWNTKCYLENVSILYVLVVLQRANSLSSTLNNCTSPLQYFCLTVWTFWFTRCTVLTKYIMLARLQDYATIMRLANYTFLWLKLIYYLCWEEKRLYQKLLATE